MIVPFILCAALTIQASQIDIIDHDMTVAYDPATHMLEVTDKITINEESAALEAVLNKSFEITSATLDGADLNFRWAAEEECTEIIARRGWPEGTIEKNAGLLIVELPDGHATPVTIELRYSGEVYDVPKASSFSRQQIADQTTGLISEEGVYVAPSTFWYLTRPEALVRYRMVASGPAGWDMMSEGDILSREEKDGAVVTTFGSEHPFDGIHLIAGQYVIGKLEHGDIDILTYFFPGSEELSQRYLEACKRYLEMYEEMLGPYPFGKFAVVENFFPSGYGMPSYTLLGSQVIRLPFIINISLGHEIAHNYWGNSVYVDWRTGNWCEGITTYSADYHYLELEGPEGAAEYRRNTLRDYTNYVGEGKDFALRNFASRHDSATRAVGYGKSMMVFHTIRRALGDEDYWAAIKEIVKRNQWRNASWEDLIAVFSEIGGQDINWVLKQYVDRAGSPFIKLENASMTTTAESGSVVQGWDVSFTLSQNEPVYSLDIPVHIETVGETVVKNVRLEGTTGEYKINVAAYPYSISIDPDCQLFRRLHRDEIPPVLSQVYGGPKQVIVLPTVGDEAKLEAYGALAEALNGNGAAQVKRADEIGEEELAGSTLIILGGPSENAVAERWEDALPGGSIVNSGGFVLAGEEHAAGSLAAVACFRNPDNAELGAVVIAGNDAGAVASLGRRLLHYGKYSYLGFKDGQNIVKGIWEIESSPLIARFESTDK